ncbi:MAG: orotate phosphoribosyltransferase [Firmicutes bacterium]|nr:orotate phosphoribosyltransferase [Bacillota bacterium]
MMSKMEQLRQEILELVYKKAYQRRRVRLASGRESDFYVDCRQVTLTAEGAYKLARYILGLIRRENLSVKAVGGPVMGAVPLAAAVSALSYEEFLRDPDACLFDTFYVRSEPKGHGTGKQIEGPFPGEGTPVLVLDDVLTTGGSVLKAVSVLREAGYQVKTVLVIVDRQEGGRENLEREGLEVLSILTREDLENFQSGLPLP